MMRNAIVIATLSLFLLSLVAAQAQPKLAFGSMQSGEKASVLPGDTVVFKLYFFVDSEYGNRITHITLNPTNIPNGWNVSINPPIHESVILLNGAEKTITETLYVEPKPVLNDSEIPDPKPDGVSYLRSPSGKGFLQAKMAEVSITVPEDAKVGVTETIKVEAAAQWYGDAGVVLFSQARDFPYTITVASAGGFTEEVVVPKLNATSNATSNVTQNATSMGTPEQGIGTAVAIVIAVVIIAAGFYLFMRFRKPQEPKKSGKQSAPDRASELIDRLAE